MSNLIGQQIDHFQLTTCLSQGGIVETYLGKSERLNTTVVVKVLSLQLTTEQRELFQHKAHTIAALTHRHLIRLSGFSVHGDRPYLLQEYFPSGSLRRVHPYGTRIRLEQVLSYVKQLADALHYLHSSRLAHGDIRPEKVLLSKEGTLVLNDTGIVDLVLALAPKSEYPPRKALAYLAPERFRGQLLPASDQYSLALMIYEWLSGQPPFQGSDSQIISGHQMLLPPTLRAKAPEIPPRVEQVIMTALAKEPAARFASVQAFAAALIHASASVGTEAKAFVGSFPVASSPHSIDNGRLPPVPFPSSAGSHVVSTPPSSTRPSQISRRAVITAICASGIALAAVIGGGMVVANSINPPSTPQPVKRSATSAGGKLLATFQGMGNISYLSWSSDGKMLATGGVAAHGTQVWEVSTGKRIAQSSYKLDDASADANASSECVWVGNTFLLATIDTTDQQNPVIRVIDVIHNNETYIYRWYAQQKQNGGASPVHLAWSPDGSMIASTNDAEGFRVWHAGTGQDISQFLGQDSDLGIAAFLDSDNKIAWAPDSKRVASWSGYGVIHIWDSSNGQLICRYTKHWDQHKKDQSLPEVDVHLSWSPDGMSIASYVPTNPYAHSVDGLLHIWDAHSGNELNILKSVPQDSVMVDMRWSTDSQLLACVMNDLSIYIVDVRTGKVVTRRRNVYIQGEIDEVAWHPHSHNIASVRRSATDPDGRDKGYIWDANTGKELVQLNSLAFASPAWSPDGKLLALSAFVAEGSSDIEVQVWQV
ncbi:hypothetical protein EPA93_45935 [Ktedonosporobacter rubrisoli]|uniref:non-specific serine/threonine protein kinase n=1 Tax=Ktedonosporobacter rubrisoli TaxID=2509675 RepID=A0A4P6K6B1_KTERU|nr:serine/threonine-protein kinase [Ktedonosporobacter rubrisoli]QBD83794.1 hypothetical protein EPA93_45935 [Ktedonosporobacter rubrisoli]